ncbi:hypothetical protein Pan110_24120 [Gimesia panareensis]|nr:hypothetical protein Pan110_24120 [Gimesia panareensis]
MFYTKVVSTGANALRLIFFSVVEVLNEDKSNRLPSTTVKNHIANAIDLLITLKCIK